MMKIGLSKSYRFREKLEDVVYWLPDKIKRFCRNIRRLRRYLPVIWNNYEFDWTYLTEVMHTKLKLMEEFYESDRPWSMDAKKCLKRIKICRILCERLHTFGYNDMLDLKYHQKEFDKFIKALNAGEPTITCHTIGWVDKRWHKYEQHMKQQDLDLLCKLMKKYLFTWWD